MPTLIVVATLCALTIWVHWDIYQRSKQVKQACLDHGFLIGRAVGRAEEDERWSYRLRLVADDIDVVRELADFDTKAAEWVTESKQIALRSGVSKERVES